MKEDETSPQLNAEKESPERFTLPLDVLYFDPNNIRLSDEPQFHRIKNESDYFERDIQEQVRSALIGKQQAFIEDLLASFQQNGWLEMEPIRVRQVGSRYLVTDGNRRVAALARLRTIHRAGNAIGELDPVVFDNLPVVRVPPHESGAARTLIMTALTHIGGKRKWSPTSQAFVLSELLFKHKKSAEDLCQFLNLSRRDFNTLIRAEALANAYKESEFGLQYTPKLFALFREVVNYPMLRDWLDWDVNQEKPNAATNLQRFFSWCSSADTVVDDSGVEDVGISTPPGPVLQSPSQLKDLVRIVQSARATTILAESRDWSLALSHVAKTPVTLSQVRWEPYHEIRETHFDAIEIVNYRGLQGVHLERPGRINLIAGINNTGKTSLLEAIYLLGRQSDSRAVLDVLRRRAHTEEIPETKVLLSLLPARVLLQGRYENSPFHYELHVSTAPEDEQIDRATFERTLEIISRYADREQRSRTFLFSIGAAQIHLRGEARCLCPAEFSSPFSLAEPAGLVAANEASSEAGVKKEIIDFLRETIVEDLESIELVNAFSRFHVREKNRPQPIDLATYGDGMQRIFHIAMLFANVRKGILLIDEFENAIHARAFIPFVSLVHRLAQKFQVQVFLSTHSVEVIEAWTSSEELRADVVGYGLRKTKDKGIEAVRFDGERIHKLREALGFDLRGLA